MATRDRRPKPTPQGTEIPKITGQRLGSAWSDRCAPAGRWTDAVKRSLTVLKGLTYAPTGGIAGVRRSLHGHRTEAGAGRRQSAEPRRGQTHAADLADAGAMVAEVVHGAP